MTTNLPEGILLVNKPKGKTSFSLISALRRLLKVQKIGHAGTLDPLATGVMVLMVGKNYTRRSMEFLSKDKEYEAEATLGAATDSYDADGRVVAHSDQIPTRIEIETALNSFQGKFQQIPPMFSAKKVNGKKLCDLARAGKEIEREAVLVKATVTLLKYEYPTLCLKIECSKGTYVRSIVHDLGKLLGCYAHLSALKRTKSGHFTLDECMDASLFWDHPVEQAKETILKHLKA